MVNALTRTSSAHPITAYPAGIRKPHGLGFLELFLFQTFERLENSSAPEPPVPFNSILLPFHSWRHPKAIPQWNLLFSLSLGVLPHHGGSQGMLWILFTVGSPGRPQCGAGGPQWLITALADKQWWQWNSGWERPSMTIRTVRTRTPHRWNQWGSSPLCSSLYFPERESLYFPNLAAPGRGFPGHIPLGRIWVSSPGSPWLSSLPVMPYCLTHLKEIKSLKKRETQDLIESYNFPSANDFDTWLSISSWHAGMLLLCLLILMGMNNPTLGCWRRNLGQSKLNPDTPTKV